MNARARSGKRKKAEGNRGGDSPARGYSDQQSSILDFCNAPLSIENWQMECLRFLRLEGVLLGSQKNDPALLNEFRFKGKKITFGNIEFLQGRLRSLFFPNGTGRKISPEPGRANQRYSWRNGRPPLPLGKNHSRAKRRKGNRIIEPQDIRPESAHLFCRGALHLGPRSGLARPLPELRSPLPTEDGKAETVLLGRVQDPIPQQYPRGLRAAGSLHEAPEAEIERKRGFDGALSLAIR